MAPANPTLTSQLQQFVAHAPAALAMFDRDMKYLAASPRWLADYRIADNDVIGRSHYELFPEAPERWREAHRRGLTGATLSATAEPFHRSDGTVQLITWELRPWYQDEGTIGGIIIASEDTTAQHVERELFRTLVDHLPDLAWTALADGHIDFYNRQWYEYTGTTPAEMEGWGWEKVHAPDMLERVVKRWKHSLATGESFEMEFPLRGADGVFRWFLTRVRPLRDGSGRIVRWIGTNINIDEAHRIREALRASERKFSLIFERASFAICLTAAPGFEIIEANPAFVELFGYTAQELLGKTSTDIGLHVDPSNRERIRAEYLRTGSVRQVESTVRTKSGDVRYVLANINALELDGKTYALTTLEDITERRRAEAESERAKNEAETANRAKDEFLAMLGHELRNPLAPIRTALELMRLRDSNESVRERTIIERQVAHLVRLVDDLLDIARITRGTIELARERVDIAEVTARAFEIARPLYEQRGHALEFQVPLGLAVTGDSDRLAQVISNLLTNAAKYTPAGGRVRVVAERRASAIELRVEDNGVGLSAELLPRVFDLFVQGQQDIDRKSGGLGLGLAIVRRLVEMHGGKVSAYSDGPDRGSTFTIELPTDDASSPAGAAAQADTAAPVPRNGSARRVLVIDDNRDAAELLCIYLEAVGYEVRSAHDGPSGVEAAAAFHPEAALIDIGLPLMDGYEVASKIRALPGGEAMFLVAVTGYGQASDVQRARAAGFDEHCVKPVDTLRLVAMLQARLAPASKSRST